MDFTVFGKVANRIKSTSKSGILIFLLITFSFVVLVCFGYISFSVKKYYRGDALIVNKLGQVRGSIQRYSKLKLFCEEFKNFKACNKLKQVENFIDKSLYEIEISYVENSAFRDIKEREKISKLFSELKAEWDLLRRIKDKSKFLNKSEELWNKADLLTCKAQEVSQLKEERLFSIIDTIRNIILLVIILLIGVVYLLVRKSLEKDVFVDKLTLLYNRHFFDTELKRKVWLSRKEGIPVSLIVIDIDFFKKINDTFGHIKGDEVLHRVARIIKDQIRENDIAFRFGGEEFIVLLTGTSKEEAKNVAERIRKAVEATDFGIGRRVTVSCGVAEYSPGETFEQFIERADKALYKAKNAGRNRCEVANNT